MAQHTISFTLPSEDKVDTALQGMSVAQESIDSMSIEEKKSMIARYAAGTLQAAANNNLSQGIGADKSNLRITY